MENLGHMPGSLTDVCLINFIILLFEVRHEIWESLVTSPQYCDQDIYPIMPPFNSPTSPLFTI